MRLLLVEDDFMLGESVQIGLQQRGHAVDWVRDGEGAIHFFDTASYDAVILDLGLPKQDGINVLRKIRGKKTATSIVVVTARVGLSDRIGGLDAGADDYLVKPFDLDELDARVRAIARRVLRATETSTVTIGEVTINLAAKRVLVSGLVIELTAREYAIIEYLALRRQRIVSRSDLESALYDWAKSVDSNAIEVYVSQIRKKIGKDFIKTRRGLGYSVDDIA
jgi:two-component system, OmpR family, response regulator QseB